MTDIRFDEAGDRVLLRAGDAVLAEYVARPDHPTHLRNLDMSVWRYRGCGNVASGQQALFSYGHIDMQCFQCLDCVSIHDDKAQCVPLVLAARKRAPISMGVRA